MGDPVNDEWNRADWSGLIELNRDFIKRCGDGEDASTPYDGPLDEETMPLIPELLRLHEYGFLTLGSTPRERKEPFIHKGMWRDSRQHPSVDFLVPYEGGRTEKLVAALLNDRQLKVKAFDYKNGSERLWPGSFRDAVALSTYREAHNRAALPYLAWRTEGGYPKTDKPFPLGETHLEESEVARTKRLVWLLLATHHETLNLLARVEERAIEAGYKRRY